MQASRVVYAASVAVHVAIGAALAVVQPPPEEEVVPIEMTTIERPEEPDEPEPEPEPVPEPVAAPRPAPAPAPAAEAAPPPEFGFVLGPSAGGPGVGGVAVPVPAPAPVRQEARTLAAAAPAACEEPEQKAKPLAAVAKPAYTDEARAAGIEGKVRIELSLDEEGRVTDAQVLKGLGLGLDEAAVAAARTARFAPARKCGRAVASKFVVAFTFTL